MISFKWIGARVLKMMMGLSLSTFSLLTAEIIQVYQGQDLQQVIDAAAPGDTLQLHGIFIGSFVINQKSLTLEGRGKPAILDGNYNGGVLTTIGFPDVLSEEQISIILKNLIIENGIASDGGGILNQFAKLNLSLVIVRNNQATSTGGGIASALGELEIKNSLIANNLATNGGGGINSLNNKLSIERSYIIDNISQRGSGGGIVANSSIIDIKQTNILRNQSLAILGVGGGLDNEAGCNTTIRQSIIRKNKASSGAGIYNAATLTVKNSLISQNQALSSRVQARGGGLFNASSGDATLIRSNVIFNKAGTPDNPGLGGGIFNNGGLISLEETRVKRNFPDNVVPPQDG